ncbi:cell wall-binding repeat-containing protein [Serinicoccus sp. LYQ131]|uniref:cell wall-binding repeat-containing protein n=1 Tax=Serinicoccus sp. LYQ131 TaxID=3378797 RepID=UPI003852BC6C
MTFPTALSAAGDEDTPVHVDRLSGTNRYETAALISEQFPDGVDTVYLANGEDWAQGADAVVAGAAAGSGTAPPLITDPSGNPAPILLTRATGLPGPTLGALAELQPTSVIILGGPAVVLPVVDEQLLAADIVPIRLFGKNRYGTAALLTTTFAPGFETVYIATGQPTIPKYPHPPMMPDALTASARAGAEGAPVLLTRQGSLPGETRAALELMDPPSITIVGGIGSVSDQVAHELSQFAPVTRISGNTRYATAAALSGSAPPGGPRAYLASGEYFADSLSVSALAASEGAPLLLSRYADLPGPTAQALTSLDPHAVRLIGGTFMLEDQLIGRIRDLLTP